LVADALTVGKPQRHEPRARVVEAERASRRVCDLDEPAVGVAPQADLVEVRRDDRRQPAVGVEDHAPTARPAPDEARWRAREVLVDEAVGDAAAAVGARRGRRLAPRRPWIAGTGTGTGPGPGHQGPEDDA